LVPLCGTKRNSKLRSTLTPQDDQQPAATDRPQGFYARSYAK
jgi:hypothetical protein